MVVVTRQPPVGRPEGVVLSWPVIGQKLGLVHRVEQLLIQQFVPEPPVKRFGKAVLPWNTRLDVGRVDVAALAPAPEGVGDELGPVV